MKKVYPEGKLCPTCRKSGVVIVSFAPIVGVKMRPIVVCGADCGFRDKIDNADEFPNLPHELRTADGVFLSRLK